MSGSKQVVDLLRPGHRAPPLRRENQKPGLIRVGRFGGSTEASLTQMRVPRATATWTAPYDGVDGEQV